MSKQTENNMNTLKVIADCVCNNYVMVADVGDVFYNIEKKRDRDTIALMVQFLTQPENMAYVTASIIVIGRTKPEKERREFLAFVASEMNLKLD